jgi:hypothetical protein
MNEDSKIIDALGGTGKVAELFGISTPSVCEWRHRGIPKARRQTLSLLYPEITPPEWRIQKPEPS